MKTEEKLKGSYVVVRGKIGKIKEIETKKSLSGKTEFHCNTEMEDGSFIDVSNEYYRIYFQDAMNVIQLDDEFYKMRCISGYITAFYEYDENTAYGYPECEIERIGSNYRITGEIPYYCDVYTKKGKYREYAQTNIEDFVENEWYEKELIVPIHIAKSPYPIFMSWMENYRLQKQKEIRIAYEKNQVELEYHIEKAQIKLEHYKDPQWIQNEIERLEKYISESENEMKEKFTNIENKNHQDSVKEMKLRGLSWKKFGYEQNLKLFNNLKGGLIINGIKQKIHEIEEKIKLLRSH